MTRPLSAPSILAAAALCLALTGCGGAGSPAADSTAVVDPTTVVDPASDSGLFDPAADAQALLNTQGVFSGSMAEVDADMACALYGIDAATVERCAVYVSEGGSAEELAIFVFTDADAAQAGAKQLGYRVADRTDELRDYKPAELTRLSDAVVELRDRSALLVIADDYTAATALLEGGA